VAKKPITEKKRLNHQDLEALVTSAEKALQELATVKKLDEFERSSAQMFALSADGFVRHLDAYPDVYVGLENVALTHTLAENEVALVCETVGWASPNDGNNCQPSQHPQRKRVRLTTLATKTNQMVSSLRFQGDDEAVLDFGQAKGTLADALRQTLRSMLAKGN
jgi:hypothetical protein